ncbi:uncharacterized protein AMSG_07572 [Thecamonas trahens ATCC 50062]|uniref:UDENN FNIP1/2-type domain-containing protein n=1 Tax=Thecamonas trahens ATCC 50062 TaxID=461836 RepID=A0A0L0DGD0_THETB|nr:hypothetical protein AMSG_07572 [Thecamonas trahens ATCC 50062]KNC51389.1 hypothetical protein AMSG_07572 [Thecamonas trahens ATCC 50062]|eukprot:XP_013756058.1 hypothetical protein AMSG_07572 [Thecamonas trahens ATCC 50062]
MGRSAWLPPPESDPSALRLLVYQQSGSKGGVVLYDSLAGSSPSPSPTPSPPGSPSRGTDATGLPPRRRPISAMSASAAAARGGRSSRGSSVASSTTSAKRPPVPPRSAAGAAHTGGATTPPRSRPPSIIPEMMFGATPLLTKGDNIKIHVLRHPRRVLVSSVLTVTVTLPPQRVRSRASRPRSGSFTDSALKCGSRSSFRMSPYATCSSSSGTAASASATLRTRSASARSPRSPNAALQAARAAAVTKVRSRSPSDGKSPSSGKPAGDEDDDDDDDYILLPPRVLRTNFALGILFEVEHAPALERLVFAHFPLLECMLASLRRELLPVLTAMVHHPLRVLGLVDEATAAAAAAAVATPGFPVSCYAASKRSLGGASRSQLPRLARGALFRTPPLPQLLVATLDSVWRLYTAPRLAEPLWLTVVAFPSARMRALSELMEHLLWAASGVLAGPKAQTRSRSFLAAAITAVLTSHLGWVSTVAPAGFELDALARPHIGYRHRPHSDPGLAQLCELFGKGGGRSMVSRTVVVGKDKAKVLRLMAVLSYFIRSGEVFQRLMEMAPFSESDAVDSPGSAVSFTTELDADVATDAGTPAGSDADEPPAADVTTAAWSVVGRSVDVDATDATPDADEAPVLRNSDGKSSGASLDLESAAKAARRAELVEATLRALPDATRQRLSVVPMPGTAYEAVVPAAGAGEKTSALPAPDLRTASLGRALFGGYLAKFAPEFVLSGVPRFDVVEHSNAELHSELTRVLHKKDPEFGSELVLVDIDAGSVSRLALCTPTETANASPNAMDLVLHPVVAAEHIRATLDAVVAFASLDMPPDSAVVLIEDRLQEAFLKARLVAQAAEALVTADAAAGPSSGLSLALDGSRGAQRVAVTPEELANRLHYPPSDIPLLFAAGSLVSPKCSRALIDLAPLADEAPQRVERDAIMAWRAKMAEYEAYM